MKNMLLSWAQEKFALDKKLFGRWRELASQVEWTATSRRAIFSRSRGVLSL
jgi:hypothetical protein